MCAVPHMCNIGVIALFTALHTAHCTHWRWVSIGRGESCRQFVHKCSSQHTNPLSAQPFLHFQISKSVPLKLFNELEAFVVAWEFWSLVKGWPLVRSLWHSLVFPVKTDVSQNILWARLCFKRLDWCVCVSRDWCVKIFSLFISNLVSTLLHPHLSINVRPFATPSPS